jgi:hypothetical protein
MAVEDVRVERDESLPRRHGFRGVQLDLVVGGQQAGTYSIETASPLNPRIAYPGGVPSHIVATGIPSASRGPPQNPPQAAATLYSWMGSFPCQPSSGPCITWRW